MINLKSKIKRLLCALLCAVCLAAPLPFTALAAETAQTVRVGFFAFDGYHMQDEDGNRSGYGYDILQSIAGYAGFKYKYVGYDKSWDEMQDMLEHGEIDVLTSAQKTPEREELFDFSSSSIGTSSAILTVKAGDTTYMVADYDSWDGIKVGMINGNSRNDRFAEFAEEYGFTYSAVYYDDTDKMIADLQSGGIIDAILTSNLRQTHNEWVLAQFAASPFYIMVKKGNSELLDKINYALEQMDNYEPYFRIKLLNTYYSEDSGDDISYSAEERAFIAANADTVFTAIINPDRAPYSYLENGQYSGVLYEIAEEIIKRSGLNIEFTEVASRSDYWLAVKAGFADIRFDSDYNYNQAEQTGYWLMPSYLEVPIAQLFRDDTTSFQSAAVLLESDVAENYLETLKEQGIAVKSYGSVDEVVEAVLSGKDDMALLPINTAVLIVRDDERNQLTAEELYGYKTAYSVAVSSEQNPILYSILKKAAASIDSTDTDAIMQRYADDLEKPFTLIGYMYDYPLHIILTLAAVLGISLLTAILISTSRRRKREALLLEETQRRNELLNGALASAEKADAAKSQFLSRVSHEMRTPLNAIIGFIELSKGAEPEKLQSYLEDSDIAAKQLLSVINDVLDMSSIESGKLKIANVPFNFKHLILSITNIYGMQCKQKSIIFETCITTEMDDWLVGDELRVNQILMNLLSNAVKFTESGHVRLTIAQTSVEENKEFLRFEVSDTGCGMSQDMKERLFHPFEQESALTAKKYGGSGLGLSIVKSLVSIMEGTIRVDSVLGEGTTFTVDMPFTKSEAAENMRLSGSFESLRILAVDDEKAELDYISLMLKRLGIRHTCVENGNAALSALKKGEQEQRPYTVCLIDWRMPEMTGVETTKRIRELYGNDVVVIVVSAYDYQQAGESALKAGANMFLAKPLFQSSLFDLLMTLTEGDIAKPEEKPVVWDFTGKRVLLAEDNRLNRIIAEGYLEKCGVICEEALNGQIAVDMFTSSEPGYYDAILMDIQMPVMDGIEATKVIRASNHPEAKTIQIIAQTADAFNEDISRFFSAGMNDHVSKPIKPEVLSKTLGRAFSSSGGR